jgi:hypothetical protein
MTMAADSKRYLVVLHIPNEITQGQLKSIMPEAN